jgi:N-acetylglutamate synthase-like GNAT family acetyltransferase
MVRLLLRTPRVILVTMSRVTLKKSRPAYRFPLHRRMSWSAFEKIPRQPGWKYEYIDGKAHITAAHTVVSFLLNLEPRDCVNRCGIRNLMESDRDVLLPPFLDAFRQTPEYAGYSARAFKRSALRYIAGFFGDVRGRWSPVSVVIENKKRIVAAAMIKRGQTLPLLDCIFVSPKYGRNGLATLMTNHVVNNLLEKGETKLVSYALLANDASLAWHRHFGFQEVPDLWVASSRWHAFAQQLDLHQQANDLAEGELAELVERTALWKAEMDRLTELEKREFWAAHPQFD